MLKIDTLMRLGPVIPVLVVERAADAVPLATALVAGGLTVLEVTLRTPAALDVIAAMSTVAGAVVGAGTVLSAADVAASRASGAQFIVSPGLTAGVCDATRAAGLAVLPGVATAGDIMRGLDMGLTHFKFFPAETSGGVAALKALAAPFAHCRFCPTGGITTARAPDYLALAPVLCVGGSWIAPPDLIDAGAWDEITRRAGLARALSGALAVN